MTLRFSEDGEQLLAALVASEGVSQQEATIRAIHEVVRLHGHAQAVSASSGRAKSRYAELMERLGK
ncbi:CopG family transcriptional regulator [Schaalia sp. 19OD2882]|uniref:CopG family transcriptional regulator n=1 Tax=Schaalia sp. 19OD2882 TaxID=2794089 RepID=UPI0020A71FB7|nr:CopG family transcriptional regulator [Schaalia sp. 19OD2882]